MSQIKRADSRNIATDRRERPALINMPAMPMTILLTPAKWLRTNRAGFYSGL